MMINKDDVMSDEGWLSAPCCVGQSHMLWDLEAGLI